MATTPATSTSTSRTGSTASVTRSIIGPLTTTFIPPTSCFQYTDRGWKTSLDGTTIQFVEQCSIFGFTQACFIPATEATHGACMPGVTDYNLLTSAGHFYSPGLICPAGWSTAANVPYGIESALGAVNGMVYGVVVSTLIKSETAIVCCPSSYTYVSASEAGASGSCHQQVSTKFSRWVCADTTSALNTQNLPAAYKIYIGSTPTTVPWSSIDVRAPTIQINFRAQDLVTTTSSSTLSSTATSATSPALASDRADGASGIGSGAIAGIVVGVVALLALAGALAWFRFKRKQVSRRPLYQFEFTSKHPAEVEGSQCIAEMSAQRHPAELGNGLPVELDGGGRYQ